MTAPSSRRCWATSGCRALAGAAPYPARPGAGRQGLQLPGQPRLLRCRGIGCTIPDKDDQAAHRRQGSKGGRPPAFDPVAYKLGMRWSAGSTGSSGTGRWPPDTTNSRSATRPPCTLPPSTRPCGRWCCAVVRKPLASPCSRAASFLTAPPDRLAVLVRSSAASSPPLARLLWLVKL